MWPEARKKARERAQKVCRKYKAVPKSVMRGQPKNDWRYHNCVGKKATKLHNASKGNKTTAGNILDNCTGIKLTIFYIFDGEKWLKKNGPSIVS